MVEAASSDEDSSSSGSSDGGFVRNDSGGDDSSDNDSNAGVKSGGDSPQRATWAARRPSYRTRGGAYRETEERGERTAKLVSPTRVECECGKSPGLLRSDFWIQSLTRLRIQDRGVTL